MNEHLNLVLNHYPNIRVYSTLGKGYEGTVYLAKDQVTGAKLVLKVFHEPILGSSGEGLRRYAERTGAREFGLPEIKLIGDTERLIAIQYPFIPLHIVHPRILRSFESVGQALLRAHCQMQNFLISQCGIALTDTAAYNFMLSKDGQFHFVDIGFTIKRVDHPRYLDEGRLGFGFAMLLLSICNINLKLESLPRSGYRYDRPCIYCQSSLLDAVATRNSWLREIIGLVRRQNASIFLDPLFYQRVGQHLLHHKPIPRALLHANTLLNQVSKPRALLGKLSA